MEETANDLVETVKNAIRSGENESIYLRREIAECERRIQELEHMVKRCDITPISHTVAFANLPVEERVLIVLEEAGEFLTPQSISLAIGYPKGKNKASTINPQLYELLRQGKLIKQAESNGSKPMYKFVVPKK